MQATQAAAAAEKAAKAGDAGVAALSLEDDSTEDLDPNLYFERRLKHLETTKVPTQRHLLLSQMQRLNLLRAPPGARADACCTVLTLQTSLKQALA